MSRRPANQMHATQRRQPLTLPKRRKHLAAMCLALLLFVGGPVLATQWLGSKSAAVSEGTVTVPDIPEAPVIAQLDQEDAELPDLLAGAIAIGENPTDALVGETDALGNPVSRDTRSDTSPAPVVISTSALPLDRSLTRMSRFGPIPGPNSSGKTALNAYKAAPPLVDDGRKPVALIVGGLGINGPLTRRAIDELPSAVTLSFAAHAPGLQTWIDQARMAGHEVLIEIPMEGETFNPSEPGADRTLRSDASATDNRGHLHSLLSRGQGYAGLINFNGRNFLSRTDVAASFLAEVKASGLGFFVDGSFETPSLAALASSVELPFKSGFGIIDPQPNRNLIDEQLRALTVEAKISNTPVGVGFVYPETLDAVKGWAATLASDDLVLVPATAALQ